MCIRDRTKYATFIKTPKTDDGKTATLLNWSRGGVYFTVDAKTAIITVTIDVLAKFKEFEEQKYIGQLKYDLSTVSYTHLDVYKRQRYWFPLR